MRIFLFLVVLFSSTLHAQYVSSDLYDSDVPISWLGIDFSKTRIIGDLKSTPESMVNDVFTRWNRESKMGAQRIAEALSRPSLRMELKYTEAINSAINPELLIGDLDKVYMIYVNEIAQHFLLYDFDSEEGLGLMFLLEKLDTENKEVSGHMLLIDLDDSRLIRTYYLKSPAPFKMEVVDYNVIISLLIEDFADRIRRD